MFHRLPGQVGRRGSAGTMLAFSSWSYVHHIYPVSTTLYVDEVRHVPLHESIRGGRDHDFEIDYLDWREAEPGQSVQMSIRIDPQAISRVSCSSSWSMIGIGCSRK